MINFRFLGMSAKAVHGQISASFVDPPEHLSSGNLVYLLVPKELYWIHCVPPNKMQVPSSYPPKFSYSPGTFQRPSLPSLPSPGKGKQLSSFAPIATGVDLHYSTSHFDAIICLVSSTRWLVPGG